MYSYSQVYAQNINIKEECNVLVLAGAVPLITAGIHLSCVCGTCGILADVATES